MAVAFGPRTHRMEQFRIGAAHMGAPRVKGRKLNKRQKRQVKNMIGRNIEHKYKYFDVSATSIDANGVLTSSWTQISQGVQTANRVGDEIMIKQINVNASFIVGDTTNFMRMIIFRWHLDNNVTSPAQGDIIQNTASNVFSSPINQNSVEEKKITIVKDIYFPMSATGSNAAKTFRFKLFGRRLGPKKVYFNPAGTTGFGHVYALFLSDSVAATHPTAAISTETIYTDA